MCWYILDCSISRERDYYRDIERFRKRGNFETDEREEEEEEEGIEGNRR